MIDLHCHVLPGIDDGPETMDGSLELARAASAQGTTVLVATPHVTYDHIHNTSERILAAVEEVNRALRKQRIDVMVLPGAEVALERAGELEDDELAALRLGGGPWLLVECPMFAGGMGVDGQLHALASRGNKIVLAHPERCPVFQNDLHLLERLVGAGMLGQVTASALTGQFGRTVERIARDMVDRDLIQIAASDAHNAGRRPPVIRDHLEDAGLDGRADWMGFDVPEAVLAGTSIPYRPKEERSQGKRGLFGRARGARQPHGRTVPATICSAEWRSARAQVADRPRPTAHRGRTGAGGEIWSRIATEILPARSAARLCRRSRPWLRWAVHAATIPRTGGAVLRAARRVLRSDQLRQRDDHPREDEHHDEDLTPHPERGHRSELSPPRAGP